MSETLSSEAVATETMSGSGSGLVSGLNWSAQEIKNLRSRLGWSQAEFARRMKTPLATVSAWELGSMTIEEHHHPTMASIQGEADSCAERVQRRPIAESIMRDRKLSQIHDFDVLSSLADDIDFVK